MSLAKYEFEGPRCDFSSTYWTVHVLRTMLLHKLYFSCISVYVQVQ